VYFCPQSGYISHERIQQLAEAWIAHASSLASPGSESHECSSAVPAPTSPGVAVGAWKAASERTRLRIRKSWTYRAVGALQRTWILTKRTALIIRRNVVLVSVRIWIYGMMSVLLSTVWLHVAQTDARINDRLSIHFFAVALFSTMSVSAVPIYLEERPVFIREYNNGLYVTGQLGSNRMVGHFVVSYSTSFSAYTLRRPRHLQWRL